MKPTLKLLAPALAVIALVSACLPSASSGRSSSHKTKLSASKLDPRFAEFRYTFKKNRTFRSVSIFSTSNGSTWMRRKLTSPSLSPKLASLNSTSNPNFG